MTVSGKRKSGSTARGRRSEGGASNGAISHGIRFTGSLKRSVAAAALRAPSGKRLRADSSASGASAGASGTAESRAPGGGAKSSGSSPFPDFSRPTAADVRKLHGALARRFGERRRTRSKREILDTVVGAILSQNTTNTNSHRAFMQLKTRFKTWEAVRVAHRKEVEECIKCGGLAPKKTVWIQHILQTIYKEQGKTSMEYLRGVSKQRVHEDLERFRGVGKKTAAIVNCFECNHPDFAVDTHIFRYATQLGWAPSAKERLARNVKVKKGVARGAWPVVSRDTVYAHMDAICPDDLKYSLHLILTDTEGGLPTVCGARNHLAFNGRAITVDGTALSKIV